MKKTVISIVLVFALGLSLMGCSDKISDEPKKPVNFAFMEGVTALTAAKMISEVPDLGREIKYDMLTAPDLLSASILKESADIALIPTNLAVQAHNKGIDYVIAGTSTWGNLYIVGTEEAKAVSDLRGKTIHTFGRGLTPEIALLMALKASGLDPERDLDIKYMGSAAEIAPLLISDRIELGVVPEPALSAVLMQNPDMKVLFDLNKLWAETNGVERGYPQSCLVVKRELVESDPEFVENFLQEYENSMKWAVENPEALGDISEEFSLGPAKDTVLNGIYRMNIGNFPVEDSLEEYQIYYQVIMDVAPDFIGGSLPDEKIYYKR